ncbi:MAG: hypothetical protein E8A46_20935 [Bradyrhizobium sp.]|uniref:hypothetical protein n=1 Tax=Bradyrhizobium sp. TaxID=376 RepID=UPI0012145A16|nr:hypothetical protein [Bradyrhizobium sp.]THD48933.1 MAG: hypothetical protein E8A46_20935 [Bradyrhizobium sp.]
MTAHKAYPHYSAMSATGVAELPSNWTAKRLRFACSVNPSKLRYDLPSDTLVTFIPMEAVGEGGGLSLATELPINEIGTGYTKFEDDDVVVAKITPCFENTKGAIAKGLKNYETTEIGDLPDPQQLYTLQNDLKESPVVHPSDIEQFAEVWFRNRKDSTPGEHKQLNAILDQAVERYKSLYEANQEEFKVKLVSFRNLYSFLSQIIPYQDSDLEKLYTYARFLLLKLPRRESGLGYEMEDEVSLRFYRLQKISEGRIELGFGEADPLKGPTEVGTGNYDDKSVVLSQLIDKLNERFGTDFKPADQLFFDQVTEAAVESDTPRTAARANTLDNFKHVFERMLEGLFIDRMEGNEEIFDRIMQDASFRDVASSHLMREIYERLRAGAKAERNAE